MLAPVPLRTATTVVAGFDALLRDRLIRELWAARPPGERWVRVGSEAVAESESLMSYPVAGGCACCLAGPAFRVTLARALRGGPWHRLIIDVAAGGHPDRLVDQLRSPSFDGHLDVSALLLAVGPAEANRYVPDGGVVADTARSCLEFASDVLMASGCDPSGAPGPDAALAAALEAAAPWPRLERIAGRRLRRAASGLEAISGWRVFSLLADADGTPEEADLSRSWPAGTTMARRPATDLLSALASDSGVAGFQAVLRTPRAWYCWRYGRGRGCGPLQFGVGRRIDVTETGWRFDNRIEVWLAAGARRRSVEARLVALDLAIQGPDGVLDPAFV